MHNNIFEWNNSNDLSWNTSQACNHGTSIGTACSRSRLDAAVAIRGARRKRTRNRTTAWTAVSSLLTDSMCKSPLFQTGPRSPKPYCRLYRRRAHRPYSSRKRDDPKRTDPSIAPGVLYTSFNPTTALCASRDVRRELNPRRVQRGHRSRSPLRYNLTARIGRRRRDSPLT
jgi:hypothetical protein